MINFSIFMNIYDLCKNQVTIGSDLSLFMNHLYKYPYGAVLFMIIFTKITKFGKYL